MTNEAEAGSLGDRPTEPGLKYPGHSAVTNTRH